MPISNEINAYFEQEIDALRFATVNLKDATKKLSDLPNNLPTLNQLYTFDKDKNELSPTVQKMLRGDELQKAYFLFSHALE